MQIEMNERFDKHPDTIFRIINKKPLIFNYKTGNVMTLNELGAVIRNKLPASLGEIVRDIAAEYDVSRDEVMEDVVEFLEVLQRENMAAKVNPHRDRRQNPFHRFVHGDIHAEKIEQLGIQECIPTVAKFELLYRCNLNCAHCYITGNQREERSGILDTEAVKRIIDQLYDAGTMVIAFTGGEIFAREDLWEIIEYADSKDFLIELLTNAALMTEADVQRLKNYRISNVQVSLYSHIPELHESVTKAPGSFQKTINIIECLAANKINTLIAAPLMKLNFRDYHKIKELAMKLGVKYYYSCMIFERNSGSGDIYGLRLSREEVRQFHRENPEDILYKKKDSDDAICYAGTNQCSISPVGDVSACFHVHLPFTLGNLTEQSLQEIWTHSPELEYYRGLKINDLTRCPECPAISYCSICPGLNLRANHDLLEPAPVCCQHAFSAKSVIETLKEGGDKK
jgi:radical SAM protein with 4Fe4S-binding SPASM domain